MANLFTLSDLLDPVLHVLEFFLVQKRFVAAAGSSERGFSLLLRRVLFRGGELDDTLGDGRIEEVVDSLDEENDSPGAHHDDPDADEEQRSESAEVDVGFQPEDAGHVDQQ